MYKLKIEQMQVNGNMSVLELIEQMGGSGVLGAGRVYRATTLLAEILEDDDTAVFLSVAGPLVPGGLKKIIRDMIQQGKVDVLITSGANITHDLLEAFGGRHYRGIEDDDEALCQMGMGRIGDLYTKSEDFEVFEKEIVIKEFPNYSISESGIVRNIMTGKMRPFRDDDYGFSTVKLINEQGRFLVRISEIAGWASFANIEKYTKN